MRPVQEVISEINLFNSAKSLKYDVLNGGYSNQTYKVDADEKSYVLRINGDQTPILKLDRLEEIRINQVSNSKNISPQMYTEFSSKDYLVSEFINESSTLTKEEATTTNGIITLANILKNIHSIQGEYREFSPFQLLDVYYQGIVFFKVKIPSDVCAFLNKVDEIRKYSEKFNAKIFCHNDFYTYNILKQKSKLYVIDWEFAGIGDPFFDLATISFSNAYSAEQDALLLKSYFGFLEPEFEKLMYNMKYYNMVREVLWGLFHFGLNQKVVNHDIDHLQSAKYFSDRLKAGYVTCE